MCHTIVSVYSRQSALVCGDFKLIHFAETGISERRDLSREHPVRLQEMMRLLNSLLKGKSAVYPRRR